MRYVIAISLMVLFAASCNKGYDVPANNMADVTFFNESSYSVSIYHSSFDGPILVDKLESGDYFSAMVSPSNNYGIGSVFSVRYWYLVDGGDLWTDGIDPDMQIAENLEAGQSYIIEIPQPSKLQGAEAFLQILNTSNMPIEFNRLSVHYRQINGEIPVPSGKTGIYKIKSNDSGVEYEGYTIFQVINNYYSIPDFTAINGVIYNFEFNGTEVIRKEDQTIQL